MFKLTLGGQCWLCRQPLYHSHHGICSHCLRRLPTPPDSCPRCGLPSAAGQPLCGRCLQRPPPWQSLTFVAGYQPPLNGLLKQFKFHGRTELAAALARLLLLRWRQNYRRYALSQPQYAVRPQVLVTVPLHQRRHWRRGFNQSALLAEALAHWLGCRYAPNALTRPHPTALQQQLDAAARRCNLIGAFHCTESLAGKRVALLDDVVTTGSTVAEISRLLRAQGAEHVQVWCVCRTDRIVVPDAMGVL